MLESGGVVIFMHQVFSHMFQLKTQVSVVEDSLATMSYVFTRRWLFFFEIVPHALRGTRCVDDIPLALNPPQGEGRLCTVRQRRTCLFDDQLQVQSSTLLSCPCQISHETPVAEAISSCSASAPPMVASVPAFW